MMNLPFAVPAGMEQSVHAYFGAWAIADVQANGLLGIARGLDVTRHLSRVAELNAHRLAGEGVNGDEPMDEDDEEENVDDGRDADKPKSDAQRPSRSDRQDARRQDKKLPPTLAALPGLEPAAGFDGFITADGIAVIEARGTLMKFTSSFSSGTSTVRMRRAIRAASADSRARAIMLVMDSPGGTVSGTAELADDVAEAKAKKPVWVYGEDLLASAAYWVASQSSRIASNRTAMVGSTGTVMVVYDMSKAFAEAGVEPVVFKSGDGERSQKGAGTPGAPITAANREYFQSLIDETNTHFRSAVEKSRPKADTKTSFAEAAVYMADRAQKLGLIDAVCSVEQFYNDLVRSLSPARTPSARADAAEEIGADAGDASSRDRPGEPLSAEEAENGSSMATQPAAGSNPATPAPATPAATLEEIEAGCPGASSDFLVAQVKKKATLAQAQVAHMKAQQERIQSLEQAAAADKPSETPEEKKPDASAKDGKGSETSPAKPAAGVPLIPTKPGASANADASASEELDRLASEMVAKRSSMTLTQAKQRVLSSNADLRGRLNDEETASRAAARAERLAAISAAGH